MNISNNDYSMFIRGVDEKEIFDFVNNCKNTFSTDCNDIDMSLIKNIIEYIVKTFTHICNQSFLTGIFPSNMKTAKVIPILKMEIGIFFPTIDQFIFFPSSQKF